jgi:hypothetical protein
VEDLEAKKRPKSMLKSRKSMLRSGIKRAEIPAKIIQDSLFLKGLVL